MNLTQWQKLGLPVALGICAAFLNWTAVSRKLKPRTYVAATNELAGDKLIQETDLKEVTVSYDSTSNLDQTLVPWEKRQSLVGNYPQRRISKDCLLTQYDLPEDNVSRKSNDEEVIKLKITKSDRLVLAIFVNDVVDLRHKGRVVVAAGRVLSIARGKGKEENDETYDVSIGLKSTQFQTYESLSEPVKSQIKLAKHFQNKEINN